MATTPIDPAVQAQLDSLRSDLAKANAQIAANNSNSKSAISTTADIINNKGLGDKLTSALNLLPASLIKNPVVQEAMGTVKDAAKLVGAITDKAIEEADATFSMYRSGVSIQMDQLTSTANSFGLSIDGLTKLMTKYNKVVSVMGIDATSQLGKAFLSLTNRGATLGLTQDEANDAVLSYASMISRTGRLQEINVTSMAQYARDFTIALNDAAQASGKSASQIKQETEDRLAQGDAVYAQASLTADEQARYQQSMIGLNKYSTELGSKLGDWSVALIQSRGNLGGIKDTAITQALSVAEQYTPGTEAKFIAALTKETGEQQRQSLREVALAMQKVAILNPQAGLAPGFAESAKDIGIIVRDVLQEPAKKPEEVDPNAAKIEAIISNATAAVNTLNNAVSDVSTGAFKTFSDDILSMSKTVVDVTDAIGNVARGIEQNPPSRTAVGLAAGGLLTADLIARYMATYTSPEAAAIDALTDAVEEGGGGGSVPPLPGGGGASALSPALIATVTAAATAAIAAYMATQSGTTPATSNASITPTPTVTTANPVTLTPTAPTPGSPGTVPTNPTVTNPNDDRQSTRNAIASIAEQSAADRALMMQQDATMNTKLDLMVQQLTALNTNITEQTTALQNAFGRGGNNVYP